MSDSVELRVVGKPVLDGASDYSFGFDEPVGFCDDLPVLAARLLTVVCPVILDGFDHYPNRCIVENYLIFSELKLITNGCNAVAFSSFRYMECNNQSSG